MKPDTVAAAIDDLTSTIRAANDAADQVIERAQARTRTSSEQAYMLIEALLKDAAWPDDAEVEDALDGCKDALEVLGEALTSYDESLRGQIDSCDLAMEKEGSRA